MRNLNERRCGEVDGTSQCDWDSIEYWMQSLEYWTESIALAVVRGETDKQLLEAYTSSVKLSEDMVDFILAA
jgi:hypothetical protein